MYCNLENLLTKAANQQDFSTELQKVTDFYGDDLDTRSLLPTWHHTLLVHQILVAFFNQKYVRLLSFCWLCQPQMLIVNTHSL